MELAQGLVGGAGVGAEAAGILEEKEEAEVGRKRLLSNAAAFKPEQEHA